jgi:hypothetical protein
MGLSFAMQGTPLMSLDRWQSRRALWILPTLCLILGLWESGAPLLGQEADLGSELTTRGLELSSDLRIPLPGPTLKPEMDGAARQAAVRALAGKLDWERFTRDSLSAPIMINIELLVDRNGQRLGLAVHNAFMAHAELGKLRDTQAMQQIFGQPESARGDQVQVVIKELPKQDLRERGFVSQADSPATFAYLELPLLNKVIVAGVMRIEKREREGAVEFYWRLDPTFNQHAPYASRWIQLERNSVGGLIRGDSFPYSGCAGFTGVYEVNDLSFPTTQDADSAGKLLIESRLLLREPQEWFAGSNFLRSKLPSAMQENARSFRRTLLSQQHDSSD